MKVETTNIPGILRFWPTLYHDARGSFAEIFQNKAYGEAGVGRTFVQDMRSVSSRGVVRGLHYQVHNPQGHLLTVISGTIFDVGLDLRKNSPTFGRCFTALIDGSECAQVYLPPGIAHGFCALSERAEIIYKCTDFYAPGDEGGVHWRDPDLAIQWPVKDAIVSERDTCFPFLRDVPTERLPQVEFSASN